MKFSGTSLAVLTSATLLLAACSSTPIAEPPAPKPAAPVVQAPAPAQSTGSTGAVQAPRTVAAVVAPPPHLDPKNAIFTDRSVYFDFDNYSVKSDYDALVERQGKYLAANGKISIKVEGNADERGGREYNLALGQKRADAVTKALKVYGARDGQLESVSWGKEKPKATGHDEAAFAENRRADLVYPSK